MHLDVPKQLFSVQQIHFAVLEHHLFYPSEMQARGIGRQGACSRMDVHLNLEHVHLLCRFRALRWDHHVAQRGLTAFKLRHHPVLILLDHHIPFPQPYYEPFSIIIIIHHLTSMEPAGL